MKNKIAYVIMRLSLVFGMLLCGRAGIANVIWSQPITTNAIGIILGATRVSSTPSGWCMAEDFELPCAATIHAVKWWGGSANRIITVGDEYSILTNLFHLTFCTARYDGHRYLPGNPLFEKQGEVIGRLVGTNQLGELVYCYELDVGSELLLAPGARYFLSIQHMTEEQWGWQDTQSQGSFLENAVLSISGLGFTWIDFFPKTDLAFELIVPEPKPEMLVLFAVAMVAIWVLRPFHFR